MYLKTQSISMWQRLMGSRARGSRVSGHLRHLFGNSMEKSTMRPPRLMEQSQAHVDNLGFVLRDKPQPIFRREGCDLCYTDLISLKQALCDTLLEVPTLLGELMHLSTQSEVISADSTHRFPGQGLSHPINGSCRGDLIVNFLIEITKTMSQKGSSPL